jgi:mRNA interferase HicA
VKGSEFLKKVRRAGRRRGIRVVFDPTRGKGSHGTLFFGDRQTIVKDLKKEISKGLLKGMCADLGIDPRDFG